MKLKILIIILYVGLISSLIDIVKMAVGLTKAKAILEPQVMLDTIFGIVTQIRLETIQVILCVGFLLLYYTIKEKEGGK